MLLENESCFLMFETLFLKCLMFLFFYFFYVLDFFMFLMFLIFLEDMVCS